MKPVDVLTSTIISVPIIEVSEYAFNPDNTPEWMMRKANTKDLKKLKQILEQ
ncbi:MAG: hypothetical protein WD077_11725 [Bacteroidia bacterium]